VDNDHFGELNAIEDEVVAVNASTDSMLFIARNEGEAVGVKDKIFTPGPQLSNE
jgi:hypothetical protein